MLNFVLKEQTKKEILSLYKRFLTKFFSGNDESFLISEAAIRWLIARNLCSCYGLYDDKKHLLCFGIFINDKEKRVMLLDYFVVLKKYRGYNYPIHNSIAAHRRYFHTNCPRTDRIRLTLFF